LPQIKSIICFLAQVRRVPYVVCTSVSEALWSINIILAICFKTLQPRKAVESMAHSDMKLHNLKFTCATELGPKFFQKPETERKCSQPD